MRKKNTFGANRSTKKCRSIYIFGRSNGIFLRLETVTFGEVEDAENHFCIARPKL